ncbi:hypothetical protein Tsubulata_038245 [Turnera subulata]|uniref:Uncharacterized protein n=1 Tax=Turnera subulata TaxID=218843 RepID=A0A9Q0GAS2_9ROSI|nr:hypothetical protein Tsubulata_038245 [Turnera subulata]
MRSDMVVGGPPRSRRRSRTRSCRGWLVKLRQCCCRGWRWCWCRGGGRRGSGHRLKGEWSPVWWRARRKRKVQEKLKSFTDHMHFPA